MTRQLYLLTGERLATPEQYQEVLGQADRICHFQGAQFEIYHGTTAKILATKAGQSDEWFFRSGNRRQLYERVMLSVASDDRVDFGLIHHQHRLHRFFRVTLTGLLWHVQEYELLHGSWNQWIQFDPDNTDRFGLLTRNQLEREMLVLGPSQAAVC